MLLSGHYNFCNAKNMNRIAELDKCNNLLRNKTLWIYRSKPMEMI